MIGRRGGNFCQGVNPFGIGDRIVTAARGSGSGYRDAADWIAIGVGYSAADDLS